MLPAEQTSKGVRCAIYTRTSSEEGLSQEFNSLDAQRECGEAYIRSQRQAGWRLLPARYDDGGFTGANLERPALERLLADMRAGAIDCVVLYKVDRLSRSLFDFARLMQMFEEQGVSFVSVTQQFNSSTPMGRLTLHVLLSFAQFEREVVSERTRDKKGAARRKGKWMGGTPPLGYDVDGQSRLQVNEAEAAQVREIYALFVSTGSLEETLEEIGRRGWRRKRWRTRQGKEKGGRGFDRGSLAGLLRNVAYRGQVQHRGKVYGGEQAAIVEAEIWKQAQEGLRRPQKVVRRRRAGMEMRKESTATETAVEPMAAEPVGRVPRISRLMALAIRMEGLVRTGRVKDYAELARLGGVSRARVSQVLNLRNLAPPIQERLLFLEGAVGAIQERALRRVAQSVNWEEQQRRFEELVGETERG
jgi:DNA invertase Pin-like site-specific DNA recombinase/DNA-binding transcriptional regulator YdaS (Cro superfamily)